ncbi:hypothetical protein [Asticcacaulis sp.]|uniref:hypothetical protein n=1 Tax=Asticcacaulis sp. TaxID=1872648 RepID=UPI002617267A|nr:hypothetical protein [Asticcacaulis sp.]
MQVETKKVLHLACSSVCVVIVVLMLVVLLVRIAASFKIAAASASEQMVKVGHRSLPIFVFEPAKDSVTPAQIAMDYQLQMNLFILRNGFLTGTPALSACVENACKAAYTLAQLKAGFNHNTGMGMQVSQIRPLAPLRELPHYGPLNK